MSAMMLPSGRALDNIFVERLWRTVKYENIVMNDYNCKNQGVIMIKKDDLEQDDNTFPD
jgi:hypothetical protein